MTRAVNVAILAGVLTVALTAQAPAPSQPPSSTAGFKNKAPVSKEILKVTLPKPKETDLSNGVHLMVLEDHRAPLVTFLLIIEGAGGYYDPADMPGLAGFVATLSREGTENKTSEQISAELDRLAATVTVGAGISSPFATVTGSALSDSMDPVLAITADVLMHPAFSQAEIDRYKTRTQAVLMNQRSQPGFLASERFQRVVFGNHPAARVAASPESLHALTRDALVAFHKAHYVPDRAVLAVAGDITLADAKRKLDTAFASWHKANATIPGTAEPTPVSGASVTLVARPNSVQTSLVVGTQSLDRTSPDYEALTVANRVIGGPNARLFTHLREEKGYTYGAGSAFTAGRFRGSWSATTDVRTEVTDPALTDLLDEIRQMRDTPVPEEELSNIKRAIVAGFARSLENPNAILNNYIDSYVYKLPADYWDRFPDRIAAITPADIQRVAQKYWGADRLQIVAVGDAARIEPALKKLGTVRTYDTEGNEIQ